MSNSTSSIPPYDLATNWGIYELFITILPLISFLLFAVPFSLYRRSLFEDLYDKEKDSHVKMDPMHISPDYEQGAKIRLKRKQPKMRPFREKKCVSPNVVVRISDAKEEIVKWREKLEREKEGKEKVETAEAAKKNEVHNPMPSTSHELEMTRMEEGDSFEKGNTKDDGDDKKNIRLVTENPEDKVQFAMISYASDLKKSIVGCWQLLQVLDCLEGEDGFEYVWWDWLVIVDDEEKGYYYVQMEFEEAMKWASDNATKVAIVWPTVQCAMAYLNRPWCCSEILSAVKNDKHCIYASMPITCKWIERKKEKLTIEDMVEIVEDDEEGNKGRDSDEGEEGDVVDRIPHSAICGRRSSGREGSTNEVVGRESLLIGENPPERSSASMRLSSILAKIKEVLQDSEYPESEDGGADLFLESTRLLLGLKSWEEVQAYRYTIYISMYFYMFIIVFGFYGFYYTGIQSLLAEIYVIGGNMPYENGLRALGLSKEDYEKSNVNSSPFLYTPDMPIERVGFFSLLAIARYMCLLLLVLAFSKLKMNYLVIQHPVYLVKKMKSALKHGDADQAMPLFLSGDHLNGVMYDIGDSVSCAMQLNPPKEDVYKDVFQQGYTFQQATLKWHQQYEKYCEKYTFQGILKWCEKNTQDSKTSFPDLIETIKTKRKLPFKASWIDGEESEIYIPTISHHTDKPLGFKYKPTLFISEKVKEFLAGTSEFNDIPYNIEDCEKLEIVKLKSILTFGTGFTDDPICWYIRSYGVIFSFLNFIVWYAGIRGTPEGPTKSFLILLTPLFNTFVCLYITHLYSSGTLTYVGDIFQLFYLCGEVMLLQLLILGNAIGIAETENAKDLKIFIGLLYIVSLAPLYRQVSSNSFRLIV